MPAPSINPGPLMLDLEGAELTAQERDLLCSPVVGGVILFARNIRSKGQVIELNESIRECNPHLLLAVDQEGGRVTRLREGFSPLPPMQALGHWYQRQPGEAIEGAKKIGWLMAAEVLASGFDFSFAPVLDVDADFCTVIGNRSLSDSPEAVTAVASAFIAGMRSAGMAATGKHFPGHGGVRGDSHLELPTDRRDWQTLLDRDLKPFIALSDQLAAVMPAHILFPAIDATHPVGFSQRWLKDKLRAELGFAGVIFSDDLTMEGAAAVGGYTQRASAALDAGCDMVLVCNHRQGAVEVLEWLEKHSVQGSARLNTMRAEEHQSWAELENSPYWRSAVAMSSDLVAQQ